MFMLPPGVSGVGLLCLSLKTAITEAPLRGLDDLSRDVWKAHAANLLTDGEAQELSEAIHMQRMAHRSEPARPKPLMAAGVASDAPGRPESSAKRSWSYFPAKRLQRSPERAVSLERRRKLAATGPLPPGLACKFTTGELAVLRIVSDEVAEKGACVLSMPEIAARAGVGLTKARMALRVAASLGLIVVSERRVPYRPNLTNVVRIVSAEWSAWIARRKARRHLTTPPATPSHHASERKPQGQGEGSLFRGPRNQGVIGEKRAG